MAAAAAKQSKRKNVKSARNNESDTGEDANIASSDADSLMGRRNSLLEDYPMMDEQLMDVEKLREKRRASSFVEVRFQDHLVATVCVEGIDP